jgi:membrane-bound lytic murein transglycosylase D
VRTVHAKSYRVGRGDNLWRIAKKNRTSVAEIERANGLRSRAEIKPGQVLAIPAAK